MLYFLYGEDTYRLSKKLKEIEIQYQKVNSSNLALERFDCSSTNFKEIWDNFNQQSMFIRKKLFFLDNIASDEDFKKAFIKKTKEISLSNDIIVCSEKTKIKKSEKFFHALQIAKSQEFELLEGVKLKNWALKEFNKYNAEIDDFALRKLLSYKGNDLWALSSEIKKLATYAKNIRSREIDLFIRPNITAEIFSTIDAITERNKKSAIYKIKSHLDMGESPFYLLSMMAFQFRNLLSIKGSLDSALSAKSLGMHPFVFQKSLRQAQHFSLGELKNAFQTILEADLALKTSNLSPDQALLMTIAKI